MKKMFKRRERIKILEEENILLKKQCKEKEQEKTILELKNKHLKEEMLKELK